MGNNIGLIMENCENIEDKQLLAQLATRVLLIPIENLKNEFLGAINILCAQANERSIEYLFNKANFKEGLTLKEKRLLQELITKNKIKN